MSPIDTSKDFIAFYKKKGDYLITLVDNHYMNKEFRKCLELLNQAYAMYEKGNYTEESAKVKQRFIEIKEKHFKKQE